MVFGVIVEHQTLKFQNGSIQYK